ncbi:MAG: hypothetical protein ABJP02_06310 [Parasphingorhabdus sp.]|uniref:hypothetical protein n=1 Tax=Alphaproteobacteria TaxID=28211 RepID=UPI00326315E6
MDFTIFISLLTAFGFGSIVTALVQSWISKKFKIDQRSFDERKAAYIGLLEAYHKAAIEGSDAAAKEFAYWQMRCELVSPPTVRRAIQEMIETNDDANARHIAQENLEQELRKDLKISNFAE